MIIDAHVHITSPEILENINSVLAKEPYFALLASTPKNKFATGEQVVGEMTSCGVDKSIVFGFSFADMGLCRAANDYTAEMARAHDGLIGFMCVPPADKNVEAEIDRCVSMGLRGVGEVFPDGQNFPIENFAVTKNFGGYLKERRLPVIIHTNEPVGHRYPGKTDTTPANAAKFAQDHPDVRVLFAHFGGGLLFYELMPEMKKALRNVFYDTAALPFLYDTAIYDTVKSIGAADKLVFGSDYPLLSPGRYLQQEGLPEQYADMIFCKNVMRFLSDEV